MKRILSSIVILCILMTSFSTLVFAAVTPIISVTDGKVGETIELKVLIPENVSIKGGSFNLIYDNTKMEIVEATRGDFVASTLGNVAPSFAVNKIKVNAAGQSVITAPAGGGVFLNVQFKLTAAGEAVFATESIKLSDANNKSMECANATKTITIASDEPVGPSEDEIAANTVISLIDAIGEVLLTDECKAKIDAADAAFAALTETQAALVTNVDKLNAAKEDYTYLENRAQADRVIANIDALVNADGTFNLEDEDKIVEARENYEALTGVQKLLVTNLPTLEAAEKALADLKADKAAAQAVIDAINNLPTADRVVLSDEEAIVAARKALDDLTSTQYLYVDEDSIAKLQEVEETLADLKAAADQEAADREAAQAVIDAINALPAVGAVALSDEAAIVAARAAYDALTDKQQAYVDYNTVVVKLIAVENELAELKAAADQEAADKAKADAVIALIDAIGEVTLESGDAIGAAYEAFEALTPAQQALVTNKDALDKASIYYDNLLAAQVVIELIDAIGEVTLDSGDAIDAAFAAYNNLQDGQYELVTNYAELKEAKRAYDNLVAAQEVIDLIDLIPEEITLDDDCYAAIVDAETAYALLDDEVAALVTNYATLEAARMTYDELKAAHDKEVADQAAADAVIVLIEAIGEVVLEEGDLKITAAEEAYADLTDDQKALVGDYYDVLVEARATYDELKAEADQAVIDQAAADAVIAAIEAIGEVTLNSLNAIETAEKAYANLTDVQKDLVGEDYYGILVAAREAYDILVSEENKTVDIVEKTIDDVTFQMAVVTNVAENMLVTVGGKEATMVTEEDGTVKYIVTIDDTIDVTNIVVDVATGEAEEIVMGDINLDGEITTEDALSILLKAADLVGLNDLMAYVTADINGDGRITAGDAHILKGVMADNPKAIDLVAKP